MGAWLKRALDNIMEHCLQCNSTLTAQETECFTCGSAVPEKNAKPTFSDRFQGAVKYLFIASAIMTAVSLFTDLSFIKCLAATVVLFLVKNSADNMCESKRG
jgi:hypothetical protein